MTSKKEIKEMIQFINIMTTIISTVIRKEIGGEKGENILSKIDYLCSQKNIFDEAHNRMELYYAGINRRV